MKTPNHRPLFLDRFHRCTGLFAAPFLVVFIMQLVVAPYAMALPTGGQVFAGQVTTTLNGTQLTLDQASRAAIMNWQQFNIAPNELVRILQTGADAALLARVTGGDPSQLLGQLKADGRVFLINPKGILVGSGAIIDTAAFMASTLDVADADFLKGGPLTFKGDSSAGVVNLGRITAREGNVLLLAHTVKNAGEISAPKGTAGLGAGSEAYLASPDAPAFVIKFNLPASAEKTGVDNSGVIAAAQAQLEAAGGSIYDLAVNHSGVIRAAGVEHRPDGRVLLTAAGGNVLVTGTATARQAGGSGGEILIGGDYQGKNAAVANAARVQVGAMAALDASAAAATGNGGRVIVWADGDTHFAGAIVARAGEQGGDGGFAEVSGKQALAFAGTSDLSAPRGRRGTLLLDPDNITIVAGSTPHPAGLVNGPPYVWSQSSDPGSQTLGADNLTGLLVNNSVHLQAADTITVNAPVVATSGLSGAQLSFSASTIAVNATVSLASIANSDLSFFHGVSTPGTTLSTAAGATLAASRIRTGGFPITTLNGPVSTAKLVFDGFGTQTSYTATNPANAITKFVLNTDEADPQAVNYSGNVAVHSGTAMSVSAMIGAANDVTFSSAGDLTMRNDGLDVSTITAAGTIKLASTGGVLVNQAGSSLLNGAGRRLLYTSNTTGAFSLGGLGGYTQVDGVSYPNDPNGAVTLVLYNSAGGGPALVLTITANDFIKLYGQPDPTFTASYAGGTAANLSTLPSFSIQQGAHVNVGTYTIVPSGAVSGTHTLQYVNGTLRIDPATLTFLANAANRLYGDGNPAFSGTVTGFVAGDTLASATTGTLSFTSPATAASNAGAWAINGGGLTANHGNYVFQDAVANLSALTVDKAPLTATFANATRVYGAANPIFNASFTGFRNGDTVAALSGFSPGTSAHAGSPVGTYPIASGASATNYTLTVTPGTLTVTPAPLTLTVNSGSFVFGTDVPPALTYSVSGLVGGDPASVLSGVQFNTAALAALPPGEHFVLPSNPGSAQNYAVTVVPGRFTVAPKNVIIGAHSQSSIAGLLPPLTGEAGITPLPGGPQFTVGVTVWRPASSANGFQLAPYELTPLSPPGDYVLVPHIVPAAGTTLAEVERYYDFTPVNGTLTLTPVPASAVVLTQAFDPNPEITFTIKGDLSSLNDGLEKLKTIDFTPEPTKISVATLGSPLAPYQWKNVMLQTEDSVIAGLKSLVGEYDTGRKDAAGNPIKGPKLDNSKYSEAEMKFLAEVWSGKISIEQLAERMDTDPMVRGFVMPVIVKNLTDAVSSGQPLTPGQTVLASRVAANINAQRQALKVKLKEMHDEFLETKIAASANNVYALKTMPDIAISAQQAVTEQIIAGAVAAGVGAAAGGGAAALMTTQSVAAAIFPFADGAVKLGGAGAAGVAGASAAGVVTVAVSAVVIGVVSVVMLVQEQNNISAYHAAKARSDTPVAVDLAGLDLKNDQIVQGEYYTAFMAAMLETKFGSAKK